MTRSGLSNSWFKIQYFHFSASWCDYYNLTWVLILVCWLLLPGSSYLYQEEERLRLSWFGAEKGFLPIAYTTTTTATAPAAQCCPNTNQGTRPPPPPCAPRNATTSPLHQWAISFRTLQKWRRGEKEESLPPQRRRRSAAAAGLPWSTAGGRPGRRLWRGALSYMASVAVGLVRSY